jgi:hypothetical protein
MFLQPAIRHVAAIAGKYVRLRTIGGHSILVWIAEDEFARLQRRARAGRRLLATAFDDRLRKSVPIPKMVVCMVERRTRIEIKQGQDFDARACRHQLLMLAYAANVLGRVPREQDCNGVQVWACERRRPNFQGRCRRYRRASQRAPPCLA